MKNTSYRKCFVGLLWLLFCMPLRLAQAQQQNSLSGVVVDAATGVPLVNASVFIDKSLLGSATDDSGRFHIDNVPVGTFELVVSRIGYETQKREIVLTGGMGEELVFRIRPRVLTGPEVLVTAEYEKQWRQNLEKFTALLLSGTRNVKETRILNPAVLVFEENGSGDFQVKARAPLLIENHALGYRLNFVLQDFAATPQSLRYSGYTHFTELAPESEKQCQRWHKNRLRAYHGSLRHFLTIICDTTARPDARLKAEGFEVFAFRRSWERENQRMAEQVNWKALFQASELSNEVYLSFPDYLGVRYLREEEEREFLSHHQVERDTGPQESWIKLESGRPVKIDRHGRYLGDTALVKYGYWAWERLADMLPFEYQP